MNSYQALSAATVMLNLNRAEPAASLSAAEKADKPEFKRVLAAESSNNANRAKQKQPQQDKETPAAEVKQKSEAAGSADKQNRVDQNSAESASERPQESESKKAGEPAVESETDRNRDAQESSDKALDETITDLDQTANPKAEPLFSSGPLGEAIDQGDTTLNHLAQPSDRAQVQGAPAAKAASGQHQALDAEAQGFELAAESLQPMGPEEAIDNPESEAWTALFNWIASNVTPQGMAKSADNAGLSPDAKPAMNEPLARAIAELNALSGKASLTPAAELSDFPETSVDARLAGAGSEAIKNQPPLSLAQLSSQVGVPVSTLATSIESLMKTVKNQLEVGAQRESPASAGASATVNSAFGRSIEALKSGAGNGVFTLPDQVKAAVGQPQWHTAIAERVAIMASQRITSAEIQLDPPELGQLQVRVSVNQEQTHVSFVSQHAVVREALDQTAFRLREMFTAEGLNLVDVDVSGESFQQQREAQRQQRGDDYSGPQGEEPESQLQVVELSSNLVDHFV